MKIFISSLLLALIIQSVSAQLKLTFSSKDSIPVTADWYPVSTEMPTILLCHQNRYSRGEYMETALRLNKYGFNCLAIDQRIGSQVNGVKNETAAAVKARNIDPAIEDAALDIRAAVEYLYTKFNKPVIIIGSSYSASLALVIANENPKVSAIAVFSPGEYFTDTNFVRGHIEKLNKPLFATSSRDEAELVTDLLKDVNSRIKVQYIPASKGDHGSKVLWPQSPYNQEYWIALMSFLDRIKKSE